MWLTGEVDRWQCGGIADFKPYGMFYSKISSDLFERSQKVKIRTFSEEVRRFFLPFIVLKLEEPSSGEPHGFHPTAFSI